MRQHTPRLIQIPAPARRRQGRSPGLLPDRRTRATNCRRVRPRWFCATFVVAFVVALVGGCQTLGEFVRTAPKPSATISSARLLALTLDSATLEFDVDVANPYSTALPMTDLAYAISSGGSRIVDGSAATAGTVPAGGSKLVTLPAEIRFADLASVLGQVEPGSVIPYTADLSLSVDAPGVGELSLPVQHRGELPVPTVPTVELTSVRWESLSLQEASAVLNLRVGNRNDFSTDLSDLQYRLTLGGREIVQTTLRRSVEFAAGQSNDLEVPITFAPTDLGLAAFDILRGEGAEYELTGTMDCSTPFGPIRLPFERSGQTPFER